MSGDGAKQLPRAKSKKRRHLCIMDTDSSDDADVSSTKPRRKPRVNKMTSDSNKKDRAKNGNGEVAGSSKSLEFSSELDKKSEKRTKEVTEPKHTKEEAKNLCNSQSRRTSETSTKLEDKDALESAKAKGEEKSRNGEDQAAEHCPICWVPFKEQEVAVPVTCDHSFCLQCILKWTAHSNTCPVDRQAFNIIDVHQIYGGKKMRQMPIETRSLPEVNPGDEPSDADNPFSIFHSNSNPSEWDLELSNSELDYDSSVHSYMMFESTNDPEDSSSTEDIVNSSPIINYVDSSSTEDTDSSLMDETPSDCGTFDLEDLEQRSSSSLSCQNESSPGRGDYSNDADWEDLSPHPLEEMAFRQYSSSDSPDSFISSIDSLSSSPATSSSSTSY